MSSAAVCLSVLAAVLTSQASGQTGSVAGGPQLIHEGKLEEALEVYREGVRASPKSASANN